jgi:hypothetical protein
VSKAARIANRAARTVVASTPVAAPAEPVQRPVTMMDVLSAIDSYRSAVEAAAAAKEGCEYPGEWNWAEDIAVDDAHAEIERLMTAYIERLVADVQS